VPSIEITNLGPGAWAKIQASASAWPALSFYLVFRQVMAWFGLLARSARSKNAEIWCCSMSVGAELVVHGGDLRYRRQ
jgi:hypothetical protein